MHLGFPEGGSTSNRCADTASDREAGKNDNYHASSKERLQEGEGEDSARLPALYGVVLCFPQARHSFVL
jgi:hypothetical protein